ncbi:unnamed protein product [Brassica oleracea var. botrytis]|uniref:Uncharacterized protein n=1 Tax=Brassica oleracea TaxID=3712 RepID=A0A3P6G2B8_BRAOL|nr:unnamed protein product [Brassica oleracea]
MSELETMLGLVLLVSSLCFWFVCFYFPSETPLKKKLSTL